MKISEGTYKELQRLFEEISAERWPSQETLADMDLLRSSITALKKGAEVEDRPAVMAALNRLIAEKPAFDSLYSIARRFATHATHSKELKKRSDFLLVYERSPTLKSIPEDTLRNEAELMAFLLARRDRIAAENIEAAGVEEPGSIPPAELSSRYTVSDLVRALFAAGVIKEDGRTYGILKGAAEPLDYFMKNREKLEREVKRLLSIDPDGPWHTFARKGLFLKPGSGALALLDEKEIDAVVKWGNWVLTDPGVSPRSIFRGDEIAYSVITNHRELLALASPETLDRFENAAWMAPNFPAEARGEAVAALGELIAELENLPGLNPKLAGEAQSWLPWLKKLYSWNVDTAHEAEAAEPQSSAASKIGNSVKTADEIQATSEVAPPEVGTEHPIPQPADATPEEAKPTFSELLSLTFAPALRFVSGLLGVEIPGSAKLTAAKAFSSAGLVGKGGRLADASPEKFRKLAELSSRHPGGIPAVLAEMGTPFFQSDETHAGGSSLSFRFLFERGGAAAGKTLDDRDLTLLYLKHMNAAIESGPDAASLTLILEALRFERKTVIANVARLAGASLIKSAAAEARFPDGEGVPWQGNPLFAQPSERQKDLPDPDSRPGLKLIATHDGSLLFSREETDPVTGKPAVVISGDPEMLAEMAERLSASSGGAAFPNMDDAIFPLNNAMEFLAGAASRQLFPPEQGVFFESAIDFANATSIEARVDDERMMPEIVFSASPADVGAIRRFYGLAEEPALDPASVPQAWEHAASLYLGGEPFDRRILESSGADTASMRNAFERVAMHGIPETAVAIEMMLAPGGGSAHVKIPGLWNSGAGVAVGPGGRIEKILIRLSRDGFEGDGRFYSPDGDVNFTGGIVSGEIEWEVESPAMPLKTKAEIALLVDSIFMGRHRFNSWKDKREAKGSQNNIDWRGLPEILMDLGIVEIDPDLLFEEPPPFIASNEWRSGAFVSKISEAGKRFPSPRAGRHLAEIAEKLEALHSMSLGAYADEPPPAFRAINDALAALGELSIYRPNLTEDAWLAEEMIAELTRLSERKKGLSGEVAPLIELAKRTLQNDMDHDELHSILTEILLSSPRQAFNVFKEDVLQGYFWEHERGRVEELFSRAKEIVLVNVAAFPAFEKAWDGFKILSKRSDGPDSEAAFVRFLMVDAGLDFDEMSLVVSAEGLTWAKKRHALLSRGEMSGRFALAGELISGLIYDVNSSKTQGSGRFGDTVEAKPSGYDTDFHQSEDDLLINKRTGKPGIPSSGKKQAASTNASIGASQGTLKSLK